MDILDQPVARAIINRVMPESNEPQVVIGELSDYRHLGELSMIPLEDVGVQIDRIQEAGYKWHVIDNRLIDVAHILFFRECDAKVAEAIALRTRDLGHREPPLSTNEHVELAVLFGIDEDTIERFKEAVYLEMRMGGEVGMGPKLVSQPVVIRIRPTDMFDHTAKEWADQSAQDLGFKVNENTSGFLYADVMPVEQTIEELCGKLDKLPVTYEVLEWADDCNEANKTTRPSVLEEARDRFPDSFESITEAARRGADMPPGAYYVGWSSHFDDPANDYDIELFSDVLKKAGADEVWTDQKFGWSNQPEVVLFTGLSAHEAQDALSVLPMFSTWPALIYPVKDDWGQDTAGESITEAADEEDDVDLDAEPPLAAGEGPAQGVEHSYVGQPIDVITIHVNDAGEQTHVEVEPGEVLTYEERPGEDPEIGVNFHDNDDVVVATIDGELITLEVGAEPADPETDAVDSEGDVLHALSLTIYPDGLPTDTGQEGEPSDDDMEGDVEAGVASEVESVTESALSRYERELGPWFSDDSPRDVLYDIRRLDDEADVTLSDIEAYLATKGPSNESVTDTGEALDVGGLGQGDQDAAKCVCLSCGYQMRQLRARACSTIPCPKCGKELTSESVTEQDDDKGYTIHELEAELSVEGEANPRFGDLSTREVDKHHGWGRVIGGDQGDVLFNGYDVEDGRTVLRSPAVLTWLRDEITDEWSEEEWTTFGQEIVDFAYDSIGLECVESHSDPTSESVTEQDEPADREDDPDLCDICGRRPSVFEGETEGGPSARMCDVCRREYAVDKGNLKDEEPADSKESVTEGDDDWQVVKRAGAGDEAVEWRRGDVTITKETRKSKSAGLGGERYVVRGPGRGDYGALSLEGAQEWADMTIAQESITEQEKYGYLVGMEVKPKEGVLTGGSGMLAGYRKQTGKVVSVSGDDITVKFDDGRTLTFAHDEIDRAGRSKTETARGGYVIKFGRSAYGKVTSDGFLDSTRRVSNATVFNTQLAARKEMEKADLQGRGKVVPLDGEENSTFESVTEQKIPGDAPGKGWMKKQIALRFQLHDQYLTIDTQTGARDEENEKDGVLVTYYLQQYGHDTPTGPYTAVFWKIGRRWELEPKGPQPLPTDEPKDIEANDGQDREENRESASLDFEGAVDLMMSEQGTIEAEFFIAKKDSGEVTDGPFDSYEAADDFLGRKPNRDEYIIVPKASD